ncbi:guanine-9--methyltransferase domain-containing protein 2-like protein [Obelidium mucronatum]|nr:guanine-9--methyltransferase domain-containing protein 2-like protein [Obelidium mucronatum]
MFQMRECAMSKRTQKQEAKSRIEFSVLFLFLFLFSLNSMADASSSSSLTQPTPTPAADAAPLSRNALKRQRKEEAWLAGAEERKKMRKEKKKERKEKDREKETNTGRPPKIDKDRPTSSVRIVIDCDFEQPENKMNPAEVKSMAKQLNRSYAQNRRAMIPAQLSFCGLGPELKDSMDKSQKDWKQWKVEISEKNLLDAIPDKDNIVYLTADSPTILEDLEDTKAYIIGGIVDRNRYKNLCFKRAEAAGLKTAQLPIGEYIQMASRKVLTVNQVVEIMVKYLETKDWQASFLHVIPQRKINPKDNKKVDGDNDEDEGGEGEDGGNNDVNKVGDKDNVNESAESKEGVNDNLDEGENGLDEGKR